MCPLSGCVLGWRTAGNQPNLYRLVAGRDFNVLSLPTAPLPLPIFFQQECSDNEARDDSIFETTAIDLCEKRAANQKRRNVLDRVTRPHFPIGICTPNQKRHNVLDYVTIIFIDLSVWPRCVSDCEAKVSRSKPGRLYFFNSLYI